MVGPKEAQQAQLSDEWQKQYNGMAEILVGPQTSSKRKQGLN